MTGPEFIAKWQKVDLTERSASQQHFLDLCELLRHPTPATVDPTGSWFTFERGAAKLGGGDGWADVWKRGYFGWEYKGKHKDLDAAYTQLKLYAEALENPPLLVVCDLDRIVVRTNFTNTATETHTIPLAELAEPKSLEILRAVFTNPEKLKPGLTSQLVTERAAEKIGDIAARLRERGLPAHDVATFLDRLVFCLFAEDVGLLPANLVRRVVEAARADPPRLRSRLEQLFGVMATGGDYGADAIRHFNGGLFSDATAPELVLEDIEAILDATKLDWAAVDPSIFGTLFERGLDPAKRSQLGAHYTSREDIETLIEPVVMAPLRREWEEVKTVVDLLLTTGRKQAPAEPVPAPKGAQLTKARNEAQMFIRRFMQRLARVKVLDPACGSGNFLYVTLQKLKDLEKEVIVFTLDRGYTADLPMVGPWQLYGIEINRYAADLAQMVVWIGHLQWIQKNGIGTWGDPILEGTGNVQCRDALLDATGGEAQWPSAEFIVGNPPFLGGKKLKSELGAMYVEQLFSTYAGRVSAEADLCVYWFEKARSAVEAGRAERAGLLATQSVRRGASREVLHRILSSGGIFFAESDRPWVLDGAAVRISMVGFDRGQQTAKVLDSQGVDRINADLTAAADLTSARRLSANLGRSFQGDSKVGPFELPFDEVRDWLFDPNPHGRPNSDVLRPWANGGDIAKRDRFIWIVDVPPGTSESAAALYSGPFQYLSEYVRRFRRTAKSGDATGVPWWIHQRPRVEMRAAMAGLERCLVTPRVAKHRTFSWLPRQVLPDTRLNVFVYRDDVYAGLLASRLHQVWSLAMASRHGVGNDPTYNNKTCFETFSFPEMSDAHRLVIGDAAKNLDALRNRWLNPPEWVVEDVIEFPATVDGPWGHLVETPNAEGIGSARYVRLLAKDEDAEKPLKKRTLTNLYNERPAWLADAHHRLDEAVFSAYGWSPDLSDQDLLAKLLALNLEREAVGASGAPESTPDLDFEDED